MFSDEYIEMLKEINGMHVTNKYPYLKCVKTIDACPELEVGDLLWSIAREIMEGGYEYAVCQRREDGKIIKFRAYHLEDCFEVVEVEEERCVGRYWDSRGERWI